jgi:Na+/H+ antiporter NhaC
MARAERRARETGKVLRDGAEPLVSNEVLSLAPKEGLEPKARNMLIPMLTMLAMMPVGLWITGNGNLMDGSGSTSVLWAVMLACVVAGIMYMRQGLLSLNELMDLFFKGIGGLMPLALLMMFAFAIGDTCGALETGVYVAGLAGGLLDPEWVPVILFWLSGFIAFSTGTSWGTFAIMLPIGIPMVEIMGTHLGLTLAAVLAGGVFGDHCSPISDTTIISSMAAGSDHIDHVNTQLPYALLIAGMSSILFLVAGLLM